MEYASWNRVFQIKDALALGVPISSVQKITRVDRWFLEQISDLVKQKRKSDDIASTIFLRYC